jgi:hypothetical protein
MMLWGFFGGALGFPLGQSLQAAHAWHPEWFQGGLWTRLAPHMNWWNWMETTFGCTMAAVVAVGLNRNRKLIAHTVAPEKGWTLPVEFAVLTLHLGLLVASEWGPFPGIQAIYDPGLHLGLIPLVAVVVGRRWPDAPADQHARLCARGHQGPPLCPSLVLRVRGDAEPAPGREVLSRCVALSRVLQAWVCAWSRAMRRAWAAMLCANFWGWNGGRKKPKKP